LTEKGVSNGSAFRGVAQPCTAELDAWDFAILPWSISAQRCHVRCNGLLDGGLLDGRTQTPQGSCELLPVRLVRQLLLLGEPLRNVAPQARRKPR